MISGQKFLASFDRTQIRFFPGNWYPKSPLVGPIIGNCSIFTVLEKALSRKQNTQRDDEEENLGSGNFKIFNGISGYDRFFLGKSESNPPPGGPPSIDGIILY